MKTISCTGFFLLLALPLHAETYSWIDDSGTYNFTEDYSSVPRKFQKKVKRREDVQQDAKPQMSSAVPERLPAKAEKTAEKNASVQEGEQDITGGKSRAAWRKEMDDKEAELSEIELRMEQLRKQMYDSKGISIIQFENLKKEYDVDRANYDKKYKNYSELIEAVRKAGIVVEIKK